MSSDCCGHLYVGQHSPIINNLLYFMLETENGVNAKQTNKQTQFLQCTDEISHSKLLLLKTSY